VWMKNGLLSVIVPCVNEAQNLPSILGELAKYVTSAEILETIVVDESDDDTARVATELSTRYPELDVRVISPPRPRKGYGAAVRYGLQHAKGRYCVFVAADGVDPIHVLPIYISRLKQGAHLVQCSRYSNPGDADTVPFTNRFYQTLFRTLQRVTLGRQIPDSTYAFKAFDRALIQKLGLTSNRFSISPEIAFKVFLSGGKMVTIPGSQGVRRRGVSKFKFRKEGYGYLRVALRAGLHRLGIRWFEDP